MMDVLSQKRFGWLILIGVITNVLVLVLAVGITRRMQQASDRKQCELIAAQIAVYRETPPATETGQALAVSWAALSSKYGCS